MSVFIYRSVVLSFRDQASLSLGMSDIAERSTSDGAAFFETICQRVGKDTDCNGWDPCIPGVSISMGCFWTTHVSGNGACTSSQLGFLDTNYWCSNPKNQR